MYIHHDATSISTTISLIIVDPSDRGDHVHRDVLLLPRPSATGAVEPWAAQAVDVNAPGVVGVLPARLRHADEPDGVRVREAPASLQIAAKSRS